MIWNKHSHYSHITDYEERNENLCFEIYFLDSSMTKSTVFMRVDFHTEKEIYFIFVSHSTPNSAIHSIYYNLECAVFICVIIDTKSKLQEIFAGL